MLCEAGVSRKQSSQGADRCGRWAEVVQMACCTLYDDVTRLHTSLVLCWSKAGKSEGGDGLRNEEQ